MVMTGADADQLEQLGRTFRQADQRLSHIVSEVGGILRQTGWHGHDADRFISEWHGRLSRQLSTTAHALGQCSEVLNRNAREQREASESFAGGGAWPSRNPFQRAFDGVEDVVEWIGRAEGAYSIIASAKEWWTDVKALNLPKWAKFARGLRGIPGLGLGISAVELDIDVIKHVVAGDITSDQAVGELAFDVISVGISTAETALDVATIFVPAIAPVTVPVSIALGAANIGLGFHEEIVPGSEEWLGHALKEGAATVVDGAAKALGSASRTAHDVIDQLPTFPLPVPVAPSPTRALQLADSFFN